MDPFPPSPLVKRGEEAPLDRHGSRSVVGAQEHRVGGRGRHNWVFRALQVVGKLHDVRVGERQKCQSVSRQRPAWDGRSMRVLGVGLRRLITFPSASQITSESEAL